MSRRSADRIKLTTFDELMGGIPETRGGEEQICRIAISRVHGFRNHPFRVVDDERMRETVESIKKYGVLVPAIVREDKDGGYEIIAGHRRKRGCELAGLTEIPAIIRNMPDDEAVITMVDSNIQREDILPSEKAWAYRMKQEALNHRGLKAGQISADMVGEAAGDSRRTVYRYIRLTYLNRELLNKVDDGSIPVAAGEILSGLKDEEQEVLLEAICKTGHCPSKETAGKLLKESNETGLTLECALEILGIDRRRNDSVTLPARRIRDYFPENYTKSQIEEVIYQLLDSWKERYDHTLQT